MTAPNRTHAVAVLGALAGLVLAGCANAAVLQRTERRRSPLRVFRRPPPRFSRRRAPGSR
jgi:hypothetical protein